MMQSIQATASDSMDLERRGTPVLTSIHWPLDRQSMEALVDLGMSDHLIANYFDVPIQSVNALRSEYEV